MQNLQSFQDANLPIKNPIQDPDDLRDKYVKPEYAIFNGPGIDQKKQLEALEEVCNIQDQVSIEVGSNYSLLGSADYQYQTFTLGLCDYIFVVKRNRPFIDYHAMLVSVMSESKKRQRITTDILLEAQLSFCVIATSRFSPPRIMSSQNKGSFSLDSNHQNTHFLISENSAKKTNLEFSTALRTQSSSVNEITAGEDSDNPSSFAMFTRNSEVAKQTFQNKYQDLLTLGDNLISDKTGVKIQLIKNDKGEVSFTYSPQLPFEIEFSKELDIFLSNALLKANNLIPTEQLILILRINKILRDKLFAFELQPNQNMYHLFFSSDNKCTDTSDAFDSQLTSIYYSNIDVWNVIIDAYRSGDKDKLNKITGVSEPSKFVNLLIYKSLQNIGVEQIDNEVIADFLFKLSAIQKIYQYELLPENKMQFPLAISGELYTSLGLANYTPEIIELFKQERFTERYILLNMLSLKEKHEGFIKLSSYYLKHAESNFDTALFEELYFYATQWSLPENVKSTLKEKFSLSFLFKAKEENLKTKIQDFSNSHAPLSQDIVNKFCNIHSLSEQEFLSEINPQHLSFIDYHEIIIQECKPSLALGTQISSILHNLSEKNLFLNDKLFEFVLESVLPSCLNSIEGAYMLLSTHIPLTKIRLESLALLLNKGLSLNEVFKSNSYLPLKHKKRIICMFGNICLQDNKFYKDFGYFKVVLEALLTDDRPDSKLSIQEIKSRINFGRLNLDQLLFLKQHAPFSSSESILPFVSIQLGLDVSSQKMKTKKAHLLYSATTKKLSIENVPRNLTIDNEALNQISLKLNSIQEMSESVPDLCNSIQEQVLQRCLKPKQSLFSKMQYLTYKTAETLNPTNIISKTLNGLTKHTRKNKWRYLGAAGTMVALGVGYYLLRESTDLDSIGINSQQLDVVDKLPYELDYSPKTEVLQKQIHEVVFDNISEINGYVDVEFPTNFDSTDLLSKVYDVTDGEVVFQETQLPQISENTQLQVRTNGGDLIVRNQNGTFRELFQGVSEYALELQNNTQVTATGNSEMMQFTVGGQSKAIIYHEVTLPNGKTGYLSGINLTKVQQ